MAASNAPSRPKILIADDDPVVRSMLSMSLENHFEIVAVVQDSEQAVAAAAEARPDAAVIDVQMSAGGGARAVRGIVESSPDTAVIILSGDESDEVVRDLLTAGAMTYVRKGIATQELVGVVRSSIRAHRGQGATL